MADQVLQIQGYNGVVTPLLAHDNGDGTFSLTTSGGGASGTEFAEDSAHSSGALGPLALVVRRDADTSLVDTTGDYAPLQVDANGYLKIAQKAAAALVAGTAIIGKVGIDQTTPGTTNGVAITPANMVAADINAPAANTAAVVTYAAAGAGVSHVIAGVAWSYNAAPTGGNLKIEDVSGTIVFTLDITAAGPGFIPFPVPLKGDANAALIVTLAAGGASATGKVSVLGHWTV